MWRTTQQNIHFIPCYGVFYVGDILLYFHQLFSTRFFIHHLFSSISPSFLLLSFLYSSAFIFSSFPLLFLPPSFPHFPPFPFSLAPSLPIFPPSQTLPNSVITHSSFPSHPNMDTEKLEVAKNVPIPGIMIRN